MSYLTMRLESLLKQTNSFTKFLLVGIINTLLGLSIMFTCLNIFEWSYWISTLIGNSSGALISYLLNRKFTFQSKVPYTKGASRFILVIIICYFLAFSISEGVSKSFLVKSSYSPLLSQNELSILLGSCLYTILNYLGQKYFVFKKKQNEQAS